MAINTFRRATEADLDAVQAAAKRFCSRHNIALYDGENPEFEIDCQVETMRYSDPAAAAKLARQWAACMCRALGTTYTRRICIAYGHVGVCV